MCKCFAVIKICVIVTVLKHVLVYNYLLVITINFFKYISALWLMYLILPVTVNKLCMN